MLKELIQLATHLDKRGFRKEADYLDGIIKKEAIGPLAIPAITLGAEHALVAAGSLAIASLLALGVRAGFKSQNEFEEKIAKIYLDEIFKKAYEASLDRLPNLDNDEKVKRKSIIESGGKPSEEMIRDLSKGDIRVGQNWLINNSENLADIPEESFQDKAYNITPDFVNFTKDNAMKLAIDLSNEAFMKL